MTEDQQRFEEIIQEIGELVSEARNLLPENILARANSYWYAHITTALSNDNEFMGISMCSMEDSLNDWKEQEEESPDVIKCFMSQEEEDDWVANNPYQRNYCLECGKDFTVFMHNCSETSNYEQKYGCSSCDDQCGHCNV